MTQTHTKGPWRLNGARIEADNYGLIASLRGELSEHYETETTANGRLMATAPDLLAALEEVNRKLDALLASDTAGISSDTGSDIEEIQIGINAAIVKARGQA